MNKPLLIIGLIALILVFEGGRIWYCQKKLDETRALVATQTQQKVDSIAEEDIRQRESSLTGEWAARLEQEQELLGLMQDSIKSLKEELAQARYGNLSELVARQGEAGIKKRVKKVTLPKGKMITEPWSDLRIFLDQSVPQQQVTVKLTRPHKQTEIVTWQTGEVYYLKDQSAQNLLEISIISNTEKQAILAWQYYSGF